MGKKELQDDVDIHVRTIIVQNELGIHARPAAMIVRVANKYDAKVKVEKELWCETSESSKSSDSKIARGEKVVTVERRVKMQGVSKW